MLLFATATINSGASTPLLPLQMSADDQGYLRVWDIVAGGCVASYKSPHGAIHGLDLIKPSAAAAAGSAAGAGASSSASAAAAAAGSEPAPAGGSGGESGGSVPLFGTVVGANFADCSVGLFQIPGPMLIPHAALPRTLLTRTMILQRGSSSTMSGVLSSAAGSALTRGASVSGTIMSAFRTEYASSAAAAAAAAASTESRSAASGSSASRASGDEAELDAVIAAGEDLASHSALDAPVPAPRRKGVGAPPGCKVTSACEADVVFAFEEAAPAGAAAAAAPEPETAVVRSTATAAVAAAAPSAGASSAATSSSSGTGADSAAAARYHHDEAARSRLRGSFAGLSVSSARSAEELARELERLTAGVCERDSLLVDQLCAALQIAYCDLQAARAVAAEEKAALMQRLLKAERANIEIAALAMRSGSFSDRDRERAASSAAASSAAAAAAASAATSTVPAAGSRLSSSAAPAPAAAAARPSPAAAP